MSKIADELKVTYDDILTLGESNQRIELFDGEVIMSAMPSAKHQLIATELSFQLKRWSKRTKAGVVFGSPVDVVLSAHIVLQPDLAFITNDRLHINDGNKLNASPDLAVEILSESTEERDRTFKFREYARGGAKEYWLVSPEKGEVEVYQNSEKGFQHLRTFSRNEVLNAPLFPEVNINLQEVLV
ncbi:MAG: Uma2 family endonuclease [Ignavibacteriae bacterium]|nr:Uma2 family endonuclease [Ignavibacteriota bacterium]